MRIGKTMRQIMHQMEALGSELGRPPSRAELREQLPDELDESNVTKALRALQGYGLITMVGHGHYVLRTTLDGRVVTYHQTVGLLPVTRGTTK